MDGDNDSKLTGSSSGVRIGPSEDEFIKWSKLLHVHLYKYISADNPVLLTYPHKLSSHS